MIHGNSNMFVVRTQSLSHATKSQNTCMHDTERASRFSYQSTASPDATHKPHDGFNAAAYVASIVGSSRFRLAIVTLASGVSPPLADHCAAAKEGHDAYARPLRHREFTCRRGASTTQRTRRQRTVIEKGSLERGACAKDRENARCGRAVSRMRRAASQLRDYDAAAGRMVGGDAREKNSAGRCGAWFGGSWIEAGQDYYLRWQVHERRAWR
jgi:hypothetical protein